jgi:hypothetical protein
MQSGNAIRLNLIPIYHRVAVSAALVSVEALPKCPPAASRRPGPLKSKTPVLLKEQRAMVDHFL